MPDSKTEEKTIYLGPASVAVLQEAKQTKGNPYVIRGRLKGCHIINLQEPWRRIRQIAGLPDVRLHDLWHTFASVGVSSDRSLEIVGDALGDSQPSTTKRYALIAADPVPLAVERISKTIADKMESVP